MRGRVAVIGGGASGLATAWLLDAHFEVTVFEAAPVLGGHVRTLGGNVPAPDLPAGVTLDCGVLEFDRRHFPTFHRWMDQLGVPVVDLDGGETGLYLLGGHYVTPGKVLREGLGSPQAWIELARLIPMALRRRRFLRRASAAEDLYEQPIAAFLDDSDFTTWVKALLMYAYSTDYAEVEALPAALALPMLREFLTPNRWTRLPGGAYTYVEAVLAQLRGAVRASTPVHAIRRTPRGVVVHSPLGAEDFDVAVLAVPPGAVSGLLADATPEESCRFAAWRSETVTTVVHSDRGVYDRRGIHTPSEFDLFEQPGGGFGYNAFLNRVCGVPASVDTWYGLAFHLDHEVDPAAVLHRQEHVVPHYTVEAMASREAVRAHNGERRTWFVGAWLGDGLHEGAVRSAVEVSARLGGRAL